MMRRFSRGLLCGALLAALVACPPPARGGGGPENVFLVVNSASWASQTVANHFIALRQIPPINVGYIEWTGGIDIVKGGVLREKILGPVFDLIDRRGLRTQIDYIVYSSDFPCATDLAADFARYKLPSQMVPTCSLNSATYLWNLVFTGQPAVMDFRINHYMRAAPDREPPDATHGFHSWYGWGTRGELLEAGGQPYMLSTLLAVTSGRGNSVREAVSYLQRSAGADGTHPKGTVYFSKTEDIRSTKRADQFATAVADLKRLGVRAQIIATVLPNSRSDVIGAMIGVNEFSWAKSRSKILPGAICENFTSFGGIMTEGAAQTPLTELLRYGAAGTSGTVIEPYAQSEKFPSPQIHVHYARGCSLAEAYYQSLFAPAQMLIVGDPLCRPWANIPQVRVDAIKPNAKVSGTLEILPSITFPQRSKLDRWELFLDGRRIAHAEPGLGLPWDSTTVGDGYHELRVVAIEAGPIETQGWAVLPVVVENQGRHIECTTQPAGQVRWDEALKVRAKADGAARIYVVHDGRNMGQITGSQGEVSVNPRLLGLGPVSLQAVAIWGTGAMERAVSLPLSITVEPPRPLPALKAPPARLAPGMLLKLPSNKVVVVQKTADPTWLSAAGMRAEEPFVMQTFFTVTDEDMYQFQLWHYGELKLAVDGISLYSGQDGDYSQKFVPVALAVGKHRLTITGKTGREAKLRVLFGGPGAMSLSGSTFRHETK